MIKVNFLKSKNKLKIQIDYLAKTDAAGLLFARALYYNQFLPQAYEILHKVGPNNAELRYFTAKLAYELKKLVKNV